METAAGMIKSIEQRKKIEDERIKRLRDAVKDRRENQHTETEIQTRQD